MVTYGQGQKISLSDLIAFLAQTHTVCVCVCARARARVCLNIALPFAQTYYSVLLLIFALRTADKTTCKYRGRCFNAILFPLPVLCVHT